MTAEHFRQITHARRLCAIGPYPHTSRPLNLRPARQRGLRRLWGWFR